jgi:acyl-CoA thioesterase-1
MAKGYRLVPGAAIVALLLLALLALPAAARTDGERVVVCLGDSLTEGFGLAPEQAYPHLVEVRLRAGGRSVRVVNAGISGSTSASAAARLRWQLKSVPDVVVIALGGNDGLRGVDVTATETNLSEAITLAKASGARVLLAGMKLPPNYGPEYTEAFEALFPTLAARHPVGLRAIILEGVAAAPEQNQPHGNQPNPPRAEILGRNQHDAHLPQHHPPEEPT